jgi:transcriptional regulator with PAS, ATPase and Fis domain
MNRSLPPNPTWFDQIGTENVMLALTDMLECGAVFMVDADERIVVWSRGAALLLDIPPERALGHRCRELMRCSNPDLLCGIAEAGTIQGEAVELMVDGALLRVRRSGRAFFDASGVFKGAVEVLWPESGWPAKSAQEDGDTLSFHGILTRDPAMKQACQIIGNVAVTDATVLIRGETGSGKELVARAIHAESHRRDKPFLAVNCAAFSPSLLESELFGHVRGAFTGAVRDHAGVFQRADGGTLFLDEVAELPLELQAKLLRVLQERDFVPVGGVKAVRVDVRIVAATHRSLREQVREGKFREDLMYRLRVVPIFLPALRQRRLDVSLLLWHFIDLHNAMCQRRVLRVEPEAMRALLDYAWPGNVRELQNVVEYAFAVGRAESLCLEDLPPEFREDRSPLPASVQTLTLPRQDEADRIRQAMALAHGKIDDAARLLGMSRATFWRRRKYHGL